MDYIQAAEKLNEIGCRKDLGLTYDQLRGLTLAYIFLRGILDHEQANELYIRGIKELGIENVIP